MHIMKGLKNLIIFTYFFSIAIPCLSQKINGVSFVASGDSISHKDTKPVKELNANYAALMPFGFIRELSSPEIRFNVKRQWFGEREEGIKQYVRELRKKQVQIMLKPQIWVWNGKYTGHIMMNSEANWKKLEDTYTQFILMYAKTAEEINAPIFCIGTELEKFVTNRPEYWKTLIKKIRNIYKGKLTYAANWDEFKRVSFWKQLDYIGIDAYFPLSEKKTPTVTEFEKGWAAHKNEIERIQKQFNKPILFTEFGYRSVDFAGKEPWDSKRVVESVNLEAQANGLQALYNQFWDEDWFVGGFLWKWFHRHASVGGKNNNRFTPQNKPAEKLIKKLYGQ